MPVPWDCLEPGNHLPSRRAALAIGLGSQPSRFAKGTRVAMMLPNRLKYPRTPYWPYSPTIGRGDAVHPEPERFVGHPVVVTEKLDGSNVLIHCGKVYGRSVAAEAFNKWLEVSKRSSRCLAESARE